MTKWYAPSGYSIYKMNISDSHIGSFRAISRGQTAPTFRSIQIRAEKSEKSVSSVVQKQSAPDFKYT